MPTQHWSLYFLSLLTVFVVLLWFYMKRTFNYWKELGVPFIPPIPIFGNVLDIFLMKASIGDICQKLHLERQEPYLGIYVLSQPILLIRDMELIKNVLVRDFNHFVDKTIGDNHKDDPISSSSLLMVKHPVWQDLRKLVNPLFSPKKMKLMQKLIITSAIEWSEYMEKLTETNSVIDVREISSKFTIDTVTSTAFGLKSDCYNNEDAPFRVMTRRILNWQNVWSAFQSSCYFLAPGLVKLFHLRFLDKQTTDFMRTVFLGEIENRKKSKVKRDDLVDAMVKQMETGDGMQLNEDQLVGLAGFFFIAGYETSSSTLSFALYEMAKNPDMQKQLREEIFKCKEKHDSFTYDSLEDMPYLDMIVKETVRKYPVLPFLDRRCIADYKIPGTDIILEKGIGVYISLLGLHYDPEYFPDPKRFDPLRFTPENVEKRPAFSFLPFGEGPRSCVGKRYGKMSVKTGLAYILSRYEVKVCSKTQSELKFSPLGFFLQPETGKIFLEFVKL